MTRSDTTSSLTRRRVLRSLGAAGMMGLAGCQGDDGSEPTATDAGSGTTVQTTTRAPTTTETTTDAETATETETPDIQRLEDDIADISLEGSYVDTHSHWAGAGDKGFNRLDPGTFASRMNDHDVGACVLFTSSVDVEQRYGSVLQQLASDDVAYIPFLQPQSRDHLSGGGITEVYEAHSTPFMGIGEIIFYAGPMQGTSITADPWPTLFQFSADEDVPLMIHPTQDQEDGLKTMLSRYPDATIMGHGGEFNMRPRTLSSILANNENLYWTIDTGSMMNGLPVRASSAEEFLDSYDQRQGEFIDNTARSLEGLFKAAPDRVMWGTDLATEWNMDPRVYETTMSFTEAVLESLSASQRAAYTSENAKRLFGL